METQRLTDRDLPLAARLLREGRLVAFPTETVYGLGANALDGAAVARIYEAKRRPQDNPLIAHIARPEDLDALCREVPDTARLLAKAFWPGPLTLVLPRRESLPAILSAGLPTVAVRCPDHALARALIEAAGVPIAAPSANASGRPSPTTAAHVLADLDGRIAAVLDGGPCGLGLESTVVAVENSGGRAVTVLRPGGVTPAMLEAVLGPGRVALHPGLRRELPGQPPSPGMKYRHYAPRAPMTAYLGPSAEAAAAIAAECRKNPGVKAAVLCFDEYIEAFPCPAVAFGGENDFPAQAARLFDALRRLDDLDAQVLYAQCPSEEGLGLAVSNRILRAAGFRIQRVG